MPKGKSFDFLDLFAGQANASAYWYLDLHLKELLGCPVCCRFLAFLLNPKKAPPKPRRSKGHTVATIDLEQGSFMDFNSDAGFAKQPQPNIAGLPS